LTEIILNKLMMKGSDKTNVETINIRDIGIVPLNLNMLKKDIGIFHVMFNSGLYKKFLKDNIFTDKHEGIDETTFGLKEGINGRE
jgi:hypothetical protein